MRWSANNGCLRRVAHAPANSIPPPPPGVLPEGRLGRVFLPGFACVRWRFRVKKHHSRFPAALPRITMTESEFNQLVDETLLKIEQSIDDAAADIDYEMSDGVLTLYFANGSQVVINRQVPAKQIWVAARSGGYHMDYREAARRWQGDRDGEELFALLDRVCTEQAGQAVVLGG